MTCSDEMVSLRLQWSLRMQVTLWLISGLVTAYLFQIRDHWYQTWREADRPQVKKSLQQPTIQPNSDLSDGILYSVWGATDVRTENGEIRIFYEDGETDTIKRGP